MNRIKIIVFLYIFLFSSLTFAGSALQILTATPQGDLQGIWEASQITVTFGSPMIALEKAAQFKPDWFRIHPPVSGDFQWIGNQTLEFRPFEQMPVATEFTITITAGATALDGSGLKSDYAWVFRTPVPFVQYSYPQHDEKSVDIKGEVTLYFNIMVRPSDLGQHLVFSDVSGRKVEYIINNDAPEAATEMKIKPRKELAINTRYIIDVRQGLPASEGTLSSTYPWRLEFKTYDVFKFIDLNKADKKPVNPKGSIRINFSNPVEYSDLIKHLSFIPPFPLPEYEYSYHQSSVHINGPFLPDTSYQVRISGDLTDIFGNTLGRNVEASFQTRSYDPQYRIPVDESILESYGDLNIPVEMVNLSNLQAKVKIIPKDSVDITGTWFQKQPKYSKKDLAGIHYHKLENISAKIEKNKLRLLPFNLKPFLADGSHGVLMIQFYGKEEGDSPTPFKSVLLQVTELGVTAKFSPVSNAIYVTYLKTGQPVSGATIQIRDGKGKTYWSGMTDATGYCESPGWQRLGMPASTEMEPVQWAIVQFGNDIAFTHSERGTGISPWEFSIPYEWNPRDEQIDGAIFSDRSLYRAEDTVRVKVVMREKFGLDWRLTDADSFRIFIDDPSGAQVYDQFHHLNEFSSFDFEYPIPYDARRGFYGIRLTFPQKLSWDYSLYESFWVEDYRPAEFEVVVQPRKAEYIFGDSIEAFISASYLFGAPMKNAPIRWTVAKSHYYHEPEGWEGYYFNPQEYNGGGIGKFSGFSESEESQLDDAGTLHVTHFTEEPDLLTSAEYTIEGDVTDQNRRNISGWSRVIVYRGEYHVGVKPKSFFGNKGKPYPLSVITASSSGELIGKRKVNLTIMRRNWYSVRKAGTGGRYSWQSEVTDSLVMNTDLVTAAKPVTYNFVPTKSGYYLLRASSIDQRGNRIVADCSFYVIGEDYVAWQRTDDDRIELEKNKTKYKPGDVATIMIKSPFEKATAVITIEREGILDHFLKRVEGTTPTVDIPVRENYLPNVYISVMLIQGRTGDNVFSDTGQDIAKPAFKLGYINLPVATDAKRLKVNLSADKQSYKPGDRVTLQIEAIDSKGLGERSEVILAVVDKGVLNLTGYRFTNLHDYFYRNRPLFVTSSESRLNIIGQRNYGEKGENRGGGGAFGSAEMFRMRKDFKTTPYWNPSIITDEQGKATVSFQLPDNLTTFVIMAAVHNQSSEFGNGESAIRVTQTLVLKPALPRFIRYGDVVRAGTMVHNYSEKEAQISLQVSAKGIQLLDPSNQATLQLKAGESRESRFLFKATQIGTAEFTFKAVMGLETDAVVRTISVNRPLTSEVVAISNNATEKVLETIRVPHDVYPEMSSLDVKVAATQLVGLNDGLSYLFDYPYGCLEQKLSRILPMLLFGDVVEAFKLPGLKGDSYRQEAQKFFDQLIDFQLPSGGFTYWPEADLPNPYVSAWAIFAMIHARDAGYNINDAILKKGTQYLQDVLHQQINERMYPYTWNYWAATNCLILYDLALQKKPDHAYIEKLYQDRKRVPLFGLAYLLKTMKYAKSHQTMYDDVKNLLLKGLKEAPTSAHFEEPDAEGMEWCFHSDVRTTAHVLQSMLELKENLPQAPKIVSWLLLKRNMEGFWQSTQENIYVLHALNEYFKFYEKEKPDFQLKIELSGKKVLESSFRDYTFHQEMSKTGLAPYRAGEELKLEFNKKGTGRYYYETRLKYYPRNPVQAMDRGISVVKKWEVVEGAMLDDGSIAAGSVLKVTLTVATPMERNYVAVDDPLPAGFEVINTRLNTVSETYRQYKPLQMNESYWGGFNFYEIRDDQVLVFSDNLSAGVHTFVYLCKALTSGQFTMPATKVEEMYTPEVFGRTNETEVTIR